jgi:hypothetical protein
MSDRFREGARSFRWDRAQGTARFEMTSEPQEIGSGKNLAARLPEVSFAVVLSRVIESIERDPPAQLRDAVYELARIALRREVCQRHPPTSLEGRRLTLALESAIEGVETIYSKHDELRALRSLHRLVETSEIGRSEVMIQAREPMLIIDQPAGQTADANHRAKGASLNIERLLHWPRAAPLLRGAMVAIFAVALCAIFSVFSQFGQLRPQAPLSSPAQPVSAPMAPPKVSQIQDPPENFSHRYFVDAGAPAAVRGDAPLYSGHHEPQNVAPDEQRVKPPGRSCTQTYNVPSESGGLVAVNVVRC